MPQVGAVRSPFGNAYGQSDVPVSTENSSSGWWGSEEPVATEVEPTADTNDTSYQPQSYAPTPQATTQADDDEDDLGFGNSKKKPAKEEPDSKEENKTTREEKPNEMTSEDKKEQQEKGSGWGIFSLFGGKSKEKESSDEKKAVKANLGEQSSFYYDEKEKRWVNKLVSWYPFINKTHTNIYIMIE